jgi:hypothetical protein
MARKLKTYQTALGFFEQAIAAPSMKAALKAWGADSNLFHQGAAKESRDPDVIAATMAKPGVVLKRPVGSDGPFGEHAELPTELGESGGPGKSARRSKAHKPKRASSRPGNKAAEKKAALAYEREQKRRDRERAKIEAAEEKERERRTKTSRRPKPHWTRPSESTPKEPARSESRRRHSKRSRKPKTPAGTRRKSD